MRGLAIILMATMSLAATAAWAAEPPVLKDFASAADVAALQAKAKAEHKEGEANRLQRLLQTPGYSANLEYRTAAAPAAAHLKEAEFFYVVDGSGTLVTGGKITAQTQPNPDNLSGSGIEGGVTRKVAKGDFFVVPEGVPHWFSAVDGQLVMMSLHVPRG